MDAAASLPDGPPRARPVDPHAYVGPEELEPRCWRQRVGALLPGVLGMVTGLLVIILWPSASWWAAGAIVLAGAGVVLLGWFAVAHWRRRRDEG